MVVAGESGGERRRTLPNANRRETRMYGLVEYGRVLVEFGKVLIDTLYLIHFEYTKNQTSNEARRHVCGQSMLSG